MTTKQIAVLPGDGIGSEVTSVAETILKAACAAYDVDIQTKNFLFGGCSYDEHGTPVTDDTLNSCLQSDAVLLGAVGGPKWDDLPSDHRPEAGLLKLRKTLGTYTNLRPIKIYSALMGASSVKPEILEGTDILIVRELTGGIYFGQPRHTKEVDGDTVATDAMVYSKSEIERVARKAFEAARKRNGRLCSVDKSNILDTSRLWRQTVSDLAGNYPDVELSHMLVDNCAMQLIRNPGQFDVILTGNMFGDILSDEASMLTGSIGMLPSASIGDKTGLYEPVHGSAPDIAGENKANPLAAIASAAMLCRYSLDLSDAADNIEAAIDDVLATGYRSGDIYASTQGEILIGTKEMGEKVFGELKKKAITR
ncbi:MAG: 3-isopropylmalate dehydrogenase [Bacteroidetes bacterium]|jgi:3-isopropylmalate dehydrogenase|nr:3-isopropylmalate dehydrogenase [Bacteroidota bacterium]